MSLTAGIARANSRRVRARGCCRPGSAAHPAATARAREVDQIGMERRRPLTLEEVARQAGVSKTTASVVLNGRADQVRISETTRARVIAVADRLGYVPDHAARSLRRRQTGIINILLWRLGSPFFSEIAGNRDRAIGLRLPAVGDATANTQIGTVRRKSLD